MRYHFHHVEKIRLPPEFLSSWGSTLYKASRLSYSGLPLVHVDTRLGREKSMTQSPEAFHDPDASSSPSVIGGTPKGRSKTKYKPSPRQRRRARYDGSVELPRELWNLLVCAHTAPGFFTGTDTLSTS